MSFNRDTSTALVPQFQGSANGQDPYALDSAHGLWSSNVQYILGNDQNVQVGTRRGSAKVASLSDNYITNLFSWYFITGGVQTCWAVFYAESAGFKAWDQVGQTVTSAFIPVTGATAASAAFDGTRMYAAFIDGTGRLGFAGGQVYGAGIGADPLFAAPLQTSVANPVVTQPSAGVITAGAHRLGFVFTTRNGYTGALNPVDGNTVFAPITFTAADGVHNAQVVITWASIPSYLTPGGTVQIVMTSVANPAKYFLVPGAVGNVPGSPGTTTITFSIDDNDLVTGTDVTLKQSLLTCNVSGTPPFKPLAVFSYSSRLGYTTLDGAGFPVVYFSDQNAYQSLTAAFHGVYLESRQIPIQGVSLGNVCYIATLAGLYATQDNNGLPSTWIPPSRVDGSVGILSPSCILSAGGRVWIASEKGLFLFTGGVFPQLPVSYWQTPDWNRINWMAPNQIQIVDDYQERTVRVLAPLTSVIMNVTNTNPIQVTTGVLINGVVQPYPHLIPNGGTVKITGVTGTTSANTTQTATVTGPNTFTIPVAGNGAYTGGGLVTPSAPNCQMSWNYSAGMGPGEMFYSLDSFAGYRSACMALVRNLANNLDETWYGPGANGPLIRHVTASDAFPWRDIDMSSNPAQIPDLYETTILPGGQDGAIQVHDFCAFNARLTGIGALAMQAFGLDHVISTIPAISPLPLSTQPGYEYLVKLFLRSSQMTLQFQSNALDNWWVLALLKAYYTNSLPMR